MNFENFLTKVEEITQKAKDEIQSRESRIEVTALHGKYLGPKGILHDALRDFSSTLNSETDLDLSKHAVLRAKDNIKGTILDRVKQITRLERDA
jgi:ABC-type Zn uptake system ZnuABC Zn-binding protein ZnuA